ncbi:MAG: hypothetical protein J5534_13415 [Fibrobacter sp.]|nr:hypothetical protein [Fibrobacter sp.]
MRRVPLSSISSLAPNQKNPATRTSRLAHYQENGEIEHVPDSLDNEHKFFLKLLAGACGQWGRHAAQNAADSVKMATGR